jgi:hypothetical protein
MGWGAAHLPRSFRQHTSLNNGGTVSRATTPTFLSPHTHLCVVAVLNKSVAMRDVDIKPVG